MSNYEHLLSPILIRNKRYKNRVLAAPTGFFSFAKKLGDPYYRMLEERAKGGFASVCSGEITVNDTDAARGFEEVDIPDKNGEFFKLAKRAASLIKNNNSIAMMELSHLGSIGEPHPKNQFPWGPITFTKEDGTKVIGYTREMMDKTIKDFSDCALYAKDAGFDGITIHGGMDGYSVNFSRLLKTHVQMNMVALLITACAFLWKY